MTQKKLIDPKGRIAPGLMSEPVDVINYMDYDLRTVMDKPRSRLARQWRFNQFQFVSAMSPGWVFGMAIVDLKLVGSGFFYLFDFESGQMFEQSFLQPLARNTKIEPYPERGEARFRKGDVSLSIKPSVGGRNVRVSAPGNIEVDLELTDDNDPHRLVCPAGYTGWVFTRKSAGLPVEGEVRWGQQIWRTEEKSRGSVDWSCGFMRRETAWNWACLAGQTDDGVAIGLNLAAGVNETGMTENALWLDGQRFVLGAARFEFNRYQQDAKWRVTTEDGKVELSFSPSGVRKEKLNAGILASNFRQFVGTFEGTVEGKSGKKIPVAGLRGLMEDHFARW
ncbi:MAG: DUF2804 domain-containing protein [Gammaproteobacteria bacterium]|uniref:DUF2804 domain-containing protein n=1 Tax=Marinobacter litoralis TaxID=187981 RepID=A0A3M2RJH6_9GAMM|nr:DUF2804 domain-containing protein [Marinobacter litoralis]MBR9869766.1 DUF2804 domain-containing protein [Gammaproteobacteria bacterium]RMJ05480.1 hypothetical protein DOQ08_00150 [Marinobacter litoralis]